MPEGSPEVVDALLDDFLECVQRQLGSVVECYQRVELLVGCLGQIGPRLTGFSCCEKDFLKPASFVLAVTVDLTFKSLVLGQIGPICCGTGPNCWNRRGGRAPQNLTGDRLRTRHRWLGFRPIGDPLLS